MRSRSRCHSPCRRGPRRSSGSRAGWAAAAGSPRRARCWRPRSCTDSRTCRSATARRRCERGGRRLGVSGAQGRLGVWGTPRRPAPPSIPRVEVTVLLFAMLRERAGARELTIELPEGARVRDALASLGDLAAGLPLVMAVNREYAPEDQVLDPGDELALIPPVSGGSTAAVIHARVTAELLSLDAVAALVRDPRAGAVVTFQGVTREVERLEYEAYVEMAEERIGAIVAEAGGRHSLCGAAAGHPGGGRPRR